MPIGLRASSSKDKARGKLDRFVNLERNRRLVDENLMQINDLVEPISSKTGWLRFLGIVLIVYGVISTLMVGLVSLFQQFFLQQELSELISTTQYISIYSSILVGIAVSLVTIWLGVLLVQSASLGTQFRTSGEPEFASALLDKLGFFVKAVGIVTISWIAVSLFIFLISIPAFIEIAPHWWDTMSRLRRNF